MNLDQRISDFIKFADEYQRYDSLVPEELKFSQVVTQEVSLIRSLIEKLLVHKTDYGDAIKFQEHICNLKAMIDAPTCKGEFIFNFFNNLAGCIAKIDGFIVNSLEEFETLQNMIKGSHQTSVFTNPLSYLFFQKLPEDLPDVINRTINFNAQKIVEKRLFKSEKDKKLLKVQQELIKLQNELEEEKNCNPFAFYPNIRSLYNTWSSFYTGDSELEYPITNDKKNVKQLDFWTNKCSFLPVYEKPKHESTISCMSNLVPIDEKFIIDLVFDDENEEEKVKRKVCQTELEIIELTQNLIEINKNITLIDESAEKIDKLHKEVQSKIDNLVPQYQISFESRISQYQDLASQIDLENISQNYDTIIKSYPKQIRDFAIEILKRIGLGNIDLNKIVPEFDYSKYMNIEMLPQFIADLQEYQKGLLIFISQIKPLNQ